MRSCCASRWCTSCATNSPTTSASTRWGSANWVCEAASGAEIGLSSRRTLRVRGGRRIRREAMIEAVIVDAVRTPIGRALKGSLRAMRADELAAAPLRALIERNPTVDFAETSDVMMGAASGTGEQGYNVGRNALLLAGIDDRVPGCTVNRFCASSLQTLRMAFHAIAAGEGEQYIAAGVESVSRAGAGAGPDATSLNPQLDGSRGSLCDVYMPMGLTAENVAERYEVSREDQDRWAVISQGRAVSAATSGHVDAEIVSVTVPAHAEDDGSGATIEVAESVVAHDDGPRPGT